MPSLVSRLLFLWVTPFIRRNRTRTLSESDLLELPADVGSQMELAELERYQRESATGKRSFTFLFFWIYRRQLLLIALMSVPFLISSLGSPLLLRNLIRTLQGDQDFWMHQPWRVFEYAGIDSSIERACVSALLLFACTMTTVFLVHHIFYRQLITSLRVKLMLTAAIYNKAMRLSRDSLHRIGSGFIVNLVAVDTQKLSSLWMLIYTLWFSPALITGVVFFLYRIVGVQAFLGLVTMIGALGISVICTRFQSKQRSRLVRVNDQRISLTSEVLTNIRGVKLLGNEQYLSDRVNQLRDRELGIVRSITLFSCLSMFASSSAPVVGMAAMFVPIVVHGGKLAAEQVFPALALLMSLRFALTILPEMLLTLVESRVALRRISAFLREEEFSPSARVEGVRPGLIQVEGANFGWTGSDRAIGVDQLRILPGELIAVIGEVGSGKTALLLALLGELHKRSGSVEIGGAVSYVAQQPWLISDTVRSNIICEDEFDNERYHRAIELSELAADLATLPGGDQVEIGERGIALSGGQRQRVALARAFYRHADIVLLDDPLSALDAKVAHSVFDRLIVDAWGGATRILVTHRLEFALRADRVLLIEDGKIAADGPPSRIIEENPTARALFAAHHDTAGVIERDESENDSLLPESEGVQRTVALEDREVGAVDSQVIFDYLRVFVPGIFLVVLLGLFVLRQLVAVGLDLLWAFYTGEMNLSENEFLLFFVALSLLVCVLNFLRAFFVLKRGLNAGRDSHQRVLGGVLGAPMRFFEANPVGRILNRFSRDLETVDTGLPRSFLDLMVCGFDVTATIAIIVYLQPLSILIVIPVLALYYYLQGLFRPTSREGQRLDSVTRSPIFGMLSECLRGVETLRAFKITGPLSNVYARILDANGRAFYSLVAANRWLGIRLEFLGSLITLTAALSVCFFNQSLLSAALGGFALTYAMSITGAMNWLVRMASQTENNLTSFERIEHYVRGAQERWEGKIPVESWPEQGDIVLENLSIRYRDELPLVLADVSVSIVAGERVGIVGRTGSGKTTLTQALFRLLEASSGRILINGEDIAELDLRRVRRALTMIPQEPVLFSGTIRSHLDPQRQHQDNVLWDALKRVEMSDFVRQLSGQLDAVVSESGQNFSSGQRQLLCLAQALLKRSKVLVLDEATAHVDPKSDLAIQRTIREQFSHATQLIIAHRLGTVMDCDRILVFNQGRIAKIGRPSELFGRGEDISSFVE